MLISGSPISALQSPLLDLNVDWNHLRAFAAVVEIGSFTQAGGVLGLSQSAVSRQISGLETALKTPLFLRHKDGIALTETGADFYKDVRTCLDHLAIALRRINESRENPIGELRITTTMAFGSGWLGSRMNKFHERCPGVVASIHLVDDKELDLFKGEADVALRFQTPTQPRLMQRYLMTMQYHVFASREYLQKFGIPRSPSDLDQHRIIAFGEVTGEPIANVDWLLAAGMPRGRSRQPALKINSVYGIYRAVRNGLGISALPYYLTEEGNDLVEILPELAGPRFDVFFVYPEEFRYSKRIALLRDFLVGEADEYRQKYEKLPRNVN